MQSKTAEPTGTENRPVIWIRLGAEALGTFVLVVSVVSAAIFGAGFKDGVGGLNLGFLGVALALGLSVFVAAYAFGGVSGGHFNPAVTIGLAVAGRFEWRTVPAYILAQIIGGLVASTLVMAVAVGGPGDFLGSARSSGFASTGWGELSPGGFSLASAFSIEVITTAVFVAVILGATGAQAHPALAPLAIGLTLTVVALVAIPISNGSFNPARSIATAVWGGPTALAQLWMSLVAPVLGAVIAGAVAALVRGRRQAAVADR